MKFVTLTLGAIVLAALAFFITPLIYVGVGYFVGWVLFAVFPLAGNWVVAGATAFGLDVVLSDLPTLGAFCGFVGAFFRSRLENKST